MKRLFLVVILLCFQVGIAQQSQQLENTEDLISKYMDYFKQYDPTAPLNVRKARFNKIVDKENPNLSQQDRERAFKIVDTYIQADQGKKSTIFLADSDKEFIQNLYKEASKKEKDALNVIHKFKEMSYTEYKASVTQNGQVPLPESEIQKAFNQMHQNDGKKVEVTKNSSVKMDVLQAVTIIKEPKKHSFKEFRAAMLLIKPTISEQEIKENWQQVNFK